MKRLLCFLSLLLVVPPAAARAQLRLEAGPVFLTKSGTLTVGSGAIESDSGFAIRGRLRYLFGAFSIGGDVQASKQGFGKSASPGAPDNLNATFVGLVGALHPFSFVGVTPYVEVGIGKLFLSDERISGDTGIKATSYGFGVAVGGGGVAFDAELRLLRQTGLQVRGLGQEFKYDPKMVSVMVSFRL